MEYEIVEFESSLTSLYSRKLQLQVQLLDEEDEVRLQLLLNANTDLKKTAVK
jgi:hypothetical protein